MKPIKTYDYCVYILIKFILFHYIRFSWWPMLFGLMRGPTQTRMSPPVANLRPTIISTRSDVAHEAPRRPCWNTSTVLPSVLVYKCFAVFFSSFCHSKPCDLWIDTHYSTSQLSHKPWVMITVILFGFESSNQYQHQLWLPPNSQWLIISADYHHKIRCFNIFTVLE